MQHRTRITSRTTSPLVFVAGPYFAKDRETISKNIAAAIAEGQALFDQGFLALVVHNHTHHFEEKTKIGEPIYRAFDRKLLEQLVDAIKCLPTWRTSQGARLEVHEMLRAGKPVFETTEGLCAWRDGKRAARVVEISLTEDDLRALATPVPDIKIVLTIGPYTLSRDNYKLHCKHVLAAEELAIQLWNAGYPAFSPQRALCDFNITMWQYRVFVNRAIDAKIATCAVVLPGWANDREAIRQVRRARKRGFPVLGDVPSVIQYLKGEKGYFLVGI